MKIIYYILSIITFNLTLLFGQELCAPLNLNAVSSSGSVFLQWQDIYSDYGDNNTFQECFPLCDIPESSTIVHEVDNGNGGWYRNSAGDQVCWFGLDCSLDPEGSGFSAISVWSSQNTPVDSRMIFGPFEVPQNASAHLEFYEAYFDAEYLVDQNTVEVSINSGGSWEEVYTSDADLVGAEWNPSVIDLSAFQGQSIHFSFRYKCSQGFGEAWMIDHVGLYVNDDPSFSNYAYTPKNNAIHNDILNGLNYTDRDALFSKAAERRVNRSSYKPDYFIPTHFQALANNEISLSTNSRNCSDPDNETEVNVILTGGEWPDEISWSVTDSTGEVVIIGGAPLDTTLCLVNGFYTLNANDSYGDGWNDAQMTMTEANGDLNFLTYTLSSGSEGSQIFYIGPYSGCTDPSADNYDPFANIDDGSCEYTICLENQISLYCTPGDWPSEISWLIKDSLGTIVTSGVADSPQDICVPSGTYKVIGYDSWGDGWNNGVLTGTDTSGNILLSFTLLNGSIDSTYFYAGSSPGCTDPLALNYDPGANLDDGSCTYRDCYENHGFVVYLDGDSVGFTFNNTWNIDGLEGGTGYSVGVSAVYNEGYSPIASEYAVIWGDLLFDPITVEMDTSTNEQYLSQEFSFQVDESVGYSTPFSIESYLRYDPDMNTSMFNSNFNATEFTNMYDPSGIFGGLWLLGDENTASSNFFPYEHSLDSTSFVYINDDAIGAAGGAESAYLITDEITVESNDRVFVTFDLYFPQLYGSCSTDPSLLYGAGINGEGFSEDLYFMISFDYGGTWTIIDSTMGTGIHWVSRMYDITGELNGENSFIAAMYYTDCDGNWAFGVGLDNFAIHIADDNEKITINPYAGWIEPGYNMPVTVGIENNPTLFENTFLQLTAGFETLEVPVQFGLTLENENESLILPKEYVLSQNYPNPFNPSTTIPFSIPSNDLIQLTIYNILGERVNTLVNEKMIPGNYQIKWNGVADNGRPMPAGLYFYELKGSIFRDTGKMLLLK